MKKVLIFVVCILTAVSMSAQDKFPFYDRGYAGNVELGCLVKSYPYATLSTTHGYCFGKGWFLGLGGAINNKYEWGTFLRPAVGVVFSRRFAFSAGLDWSRLNYYEGKNSGCIPYWPKEITLPYISFAYQF